MFTRKLTKNRHIWKYWYLTSKILLKKLYLEVIKLRSIMKHWNFKIKKLCSKPILKTWLLLLKKIEIFHVLHDKVLLLTKRRSLWETRNCQQRIFRKVWTIYIYRNCWSKDEFLMTLLNLRFDFLFTDLSQYFGIYLVAFALTFFIHGHG